MELQLQVTYQKSIPKRAWDRLNQDLLLQNLRSNLVFNTVTELRTKEQINQQVSQIHTAFLKAIDYLVP